MLFMFGIAGSELMIKTILYYIWHLCTRQTLFYEQIYVHGGAVVNYTHRSCGPGKVTSTLHIYKKSTCGLMMFVVLINLAEDMPKVSTLHKLY